MALHEESSSSGTGTRGGQVLIIEMQLYVVNVQQHCM
jgi:hypothetical protein